MRKTSILAEVEAGFYNKEVPEFHIGDTIRVVVRITEGGKERQQAFTGTVIARKGHGISETVSLHRVAYGVGMERVFLVHSPRLVSIEVIAQGDVRRAKLYHLRGTQGKKARVRKRVRSREAEREMKAAARMSNSQKAEPAKKTETDSASKATAASAEGEGAKETK